MFKIVAQGSEGIDENEWQQQWLDFDAPTHLSEPAKSADLRLWQTRLADLVAVNRGAVLIAQGFGASLYLDLVRRGRGGALNGVMLINPQEFATVNGDFRLPVLPLKLPAIVVHERERARLAVERLRAYANMWEATFVDYGLLRLENQGVWSASNSRSEQGELLHRLSRLRRFQQFQPLRDRGVAA